MIYQCLDGTQSGRHFDPCLVESLLQYREEFMAVYMADSGQEDVCVILCFPAAGTVRRTNKNPPQPCALEDTAFARILCVAALE